MVDWDSVFILGAGASRPYGFPIGTRLLEHMYNQLTEQSFVHLLMDTLYKREEKVFENEIRQFRDNLDCADSIDDLIARLSLRNKIFASIGKICIVYTLSQFEDRKLLTYSETNHDDARGMRIRYRFVRGWYSRIWSLLYEQAYRLEDILKNKVTFITFNYDRSLEQFLYKKAKGLLCGSEEEADAVMSDFIEEKVIHIYGKIGALPWERRQPSVTSDYAPVIPMRELRPLRNKDPYQRDAVYRQLLSLSDQIITYNEAVNDRELRRRTHNAIRNAHTISFLGFGYHEPNLRVLCPSGYRQRKRGPHRVMGTAYQMGKAERERSKHKLLSTFGWSEDRVQLFDCTSEQYLREHAQGLVRQLSERKTDTARAKSH